MPRQQESDSLFPINLAETQPGQKSNVQHCFVRTLRTTRNSPRAVRFFNHREDNHGQCHHPHERMVDKRRQQSITIRLRSKIRRNATATFRFHNAVSAQVHLSVAALTPLACSYKRKTFSQTRQRTHRVRAPLRRHCQFSPGRVQRPTAPHTPAALPVRPQA
jgi:hypothetical protein